MNDNTVTNAAQARIEEFMQQLVEDPILGSLTRPADLQNYLQTGFSALINATLLKERSLFLEQHPGDRANGYAPTRQLHVKTTPVTVQRPRTREGFYPVLLPKHQRHIPESYQEQATKLRRKRVVIAITANETQFAYLNEVLMKLKRNAEQVDILESEEL